MRSHKKSILISLIVLSVAMVTAMAALRRQTQNSSPSQNNSAYKEEPTLIQEGVKTEKQKHHAKIFKGYNDVAKGRTIHDLVVERGDVVLEREVGDMAMPRSFNLQEYLQGLSCKSDAIVVGTVKNKSSQIIEEGTFTFTDYEVTIEDVLKNSTTALIVPNNNITVTRTGGAVKLNGHTIRAIDYSQRPLQIGVHYLFFLHYIPETGAYRYVSNWGDDTFQISDNQISQVSAAPLPLTSRRTIDAAYFINEIHSILTIPCKN